MSIWLAQVILAAVFLLHGLLLLLLPTTIRKQMASLPRRTTILPFHWAGGAVSSSRPDAADVDRHYAMANPAGRDRSAAHHDRRYDPPCPTRRLPTSPWRCTGSGVRGCRRLPDCVIPED